MTFFTYMKKHHKGEDSAAGDLANDMYEDRICFPKTPAGDYGDQHDEIEQYLWDSGACWACMSIFEECWAEYVKFNEARKKEQIPSDSDRAIIQQRINEGRSRNLYSNVYK